jgi:dihydroorotate dehydrogenase
VLYDLTRQFLFHFDAERSHDFTLTALSRMPASAMAALSGAKPAPAPVKVMGIDFPNPVGLAAGLDKNARCLEALGAIGFGFIEVGTVTPRPQIGNPKPRLFRLPAECALINRLGFNNLGVEPLVEQLRYSRYPGVLGVNIGKNFDTPNERALDDYLICLQAVYGYADYIAINISSPNTKDLRALQDGEALKGLLKGLKGARADLAQKHGHRVPIAVKISPDMENGQVDNLARAIMAGGMDAIIATNTTVNRNGVTSSPNSKQTGGLSGAPLAARSNQVIQRLTTILGGALHVIGVGGISSGDDALRKRQAGAQLVQIYTGFIYRGPALVRECVEHWAADSERAFAVTRDAQKNAKKV